MNSDLLWLSMPCPEPYCLSWPHNNQISTLQLITLHSQSVAMLMLKESLLCNRRRLGKGSNWRKSGIDSGQLGIMDARLARKLIGSGATLLSVSLRDEFLLIACWRCMTYGLQTRLASCCTEREPQAICKEPKSLAGTICFAQKAGIERNMKRE